VRMIRSKGVGVLFVTQSPTDVPERVLAQLGHRIQHALRAVTPKDQQALKATADTFPTSELYDVRAALTGVGTGEAVVTVLGPKGAPTATVPTRLVAPRSRMDPLDATALSSLAATGDLGAKYATRLDRESAYEILERQTEERAREAEAQAREAEAAGREAELRKQAEKLEREAAKPTGTSSRRAPARRTDSAGRRGPRTPPAPSAARSAGPCRAGARQPHQGPLTEWLPAWAGQGRPDGRLATRTAPDAQDRHR
jgi:uncharacterized protein